MGKKGQGNRDKKCKQYQPPSKTILNTVQGKMNVLQTKDTDKCNICLKSTKEEEGVKWFPLTDDVLIGFRRHWAGRKGKRTERRKRTESTL